MTDLKQVKGLRFELIEEPQYINYDHVMVMTGNDTIFGRDLIDTNPKPSKPKTNGL